MAVSSFTGAWASEYTAWADLQPALEELGEDKMAIGPITDLWGGSYGHCLDKRGGPVATGAKHQQKGRSKAGGLVAMVAVLGAWATSFVMSWITPAKGLGCRSFMELGIMGAWVINYSYQSVVPWIAVWIAAWLIKRKDFMRVVAWLDRRNVFTSLKENSMLQSISVGCRIAGPWLAVALDFVIAVTSIVCLFAAWKGKPHCLTHLRFQS